MTMMEILICLSEADNIRENIHCQRTKSICCKMKVVTGVVKFTRRYRTQIFPDLHKIGMVTDALSNGP